MSAGYSTTPLPRKLGHAPGQRIAVLGAPDEFEELLGGWPEGSAVRRTLRGGAFDIVHLFAADQHALRTRFDACRDAIVSNGSVWVSWPKRSSGVPTDLTEDVVREVALAGGLVDVKVCAIDETWSGLKLVVRLVDR